MAALLLGQPLLQRLHQLVKAAQSRNLRLFLGGQMFFGQLCQPVAGQINRLQHLGVRNRLKPLEGLGKGAVIAVKVALVLHHGGAAKVVEPLGLIGHKPGLQTFQKGQIFAQRHRHPFIAQGKEEGQEHRATARRGRSRW